MSPQPDDIVSTKVSLSKILPLSITPFNPIYLDAIFGEMTEFICSENKNKFLLYHAIKESYDGADEYGPEGYFRTFYLITESTTGELFLEKWLMESWPGFPTTCDLLEIRNLVDGQSLSNALQFLHGGFVDLDYFQLYPNEEPKKSDGSCYSYDELKRIYSRICPQGLFLTLGKKPIMPIFPKTEVERSVGTYAIFAVPNGKFFDLACFLL